MFKVILFFLFFIEFFLLLLFILNNTLYSLFLVLIIFFFLVILLCLMNIHFLALMYLLISVSALGIMFIFVILSVELLSSEMLHLDYFFGIIFIDTIFFFFYFNDFNFNFFYINFFHELKFLQLYEKPIVFLKEELLQYQITNNIYNKFNKFYEKTIKKFDKGIGDYRNFLFFCQTYVMFFESIREKNNIAVDNLPAIFSLIKSIILNKKIELSQLQGYSFDFFLFNLFWDIFLNYELFFYNFFLNVNYIYILKTHYEFSNILLVDFEKFLDFKTHFFYYGNFYKNYQEILQNKKKLYFYLKNNFFLLNASLSELNNDDTLSELNNDDKLFKIIGNFENNLFINYYFNLLKLTNDLNLGKQSTSFLYIKAKNEANKQVGFFIFLQLLRSQILLHLFFVNYLLLCFKVKLFLLFFENFLFFDYYSYFLNDVLKYGYGFFVFSQTLYNEELEFFVIAAILLLQALIIAMRIVYLSWRFF